VQIETKYFLHEVGIISNCFVEHSSQSKCIKNMLTYIVRQCKTIRKEATGNRNNKYNFTRRNFRGTFAPNSAIISA